jgi:hypothetical protein
MRFAHGAFTVHEFRFSALKQHYFAALQQNSACNRAGLPYTSMYAALQHIQ